MRDSNSRDTTDSARKADADVATQRDHREGNDDPMVQPQSPGHGR